MANDDHLILTETTRELILSKIEETQQQLELKEAIHPKTEPEFKQMDIIEMDMLRGRINRFKAMIVKNRYKEIN